MHIESIHRFCYDSSMDTYLLFTRILVAFDIWHKDVMITP